ncbi:MAG: MFS transporter [Deltaproteobacteria bacterium]|nr:MFS transporter [Deltaproteobacteria bacterium]
MHSRPNSGLEPSRGIWSRSYASALGANFLIFFVTSTFVLYPLLIKRSGGTDTDVGLVMGVFSLVSVLLRPVAGAVADRVGGRWVVLVGLAIMAAVVPAFAWVEASGPGAIALRVALGAGWSLVGSPLMALATRLTPQDRLAETLGLYGISGLSAHALAPLFAEWFVDRWGFGALFGANCALTLGALAAVASIPAQAATPAEREPTASDPGLGVTLRFALAAAVLLAVAHGAVRGVSVGFMAAYCHAVGLERSSPFFIALTVAALLTRFRLAGLPDRIGERRVAVPTAVLIAANGLLIARVGSLPVLVLAGLLAGLGQGLIFPALSSLFVRLIGERRRAFALALYATCFEAGAGLGLPAFGRIADGFGYRWMYASSGALMLLAVLVFAVATRRRAGRLLSP